MDELIKLVAAKAGISEKKATVAVESVFQFIKQQVPAPFASQIEALLKGGAAGEGAAGFGDILDDLIKKS